MLKSCSKCGRVHDKKYVCGEVKRIYKNKLVISTADKFRKTQAWQNKRREIVERDKALCQVCINNLNIIPNGRMYNNKVQVHHITPINSDYDRRLDNYNLITLCTYHHSMAEHGNIDKKTLYRLAREQEERY